MVFEGVTVDQMTVSEVAQLLGVSQDTVRRWVESGQVKAYRVLGKGLKFFFDRKEIEHLKVGSVVPFSKRRRKQKT